MEKENIDKIKAILVEEKNELEKILSSFAKNKDGENWETKFPQFGKHTLKQDENADEVEEYINLLPVEYRLELQFLDIKRAIEKIENGRKYGICERCGEEIKEKRLNAIPETKFCSKCRI